ncbi:MAG: GNAT family N-acetyltransferase [Inquilinaceae bacterium]
MPRAVSGRPSRPHKTGPAKSRKTKQSPTQGRPISAEIPLARPPELPDESVQVLSLNADGRSDCGTPRAELMAEIAARTEADGYMVVRLADDPARQPVTTAPNLDVTATAFADLSHVVAEDTLAVEFAADRDAGALPPPGGSLAVLRRLDTPPHIRFLGVDDVPSILDLAAEIRFPPSRPWPADAGPLLTAGLGDGARYAIAFEDENRRLCAYLDFTALGPDALDIGMCMTRPDRRGEGLMYRLLAFLALRFFDRHFHIAADPQNEALMRVLRHFGFVPRPETAQDNPDLHRYIRPAGTSFGAEV